MAQATKSAKKGKNAPAPVGEIVYYPNAKVSCACGAEYDAGSTKESIRVDICANCHPFFTGESRIVDAEGRVEKFRKKYNMASSKK